MKPTSSTRAQGRLIDPVFAFSLELAGGHLPGFEKYVVQNPIDYEHDLEAADFPITDAVFKAFKTFVASKPEFKVTADQLNRDRTFAEQWLRFELATAAYGSTTAKQVFDAADPQIARAIDVMPRARELALAALRARGRS